MVKSLEENIMKPAVPAAPELIEVADDADEVCCDGGGGALGHPVVWYSFSRSDVAECGYCDRVFVKKRAIGQSS